jgi:hypothetical protein
MHDPGEASEDDLLELDEVDSSRNVRFDPGPELAIDGSDQFISGAG